MRLSDWFSFVLYALLAAVAVRPSIVERVGIDLKALEVEAILVAFLLLVAINLGWLLFVRTIEPATGVTTLREDRDSRDRRGAAA